MLGEFQITRLSVVILARNHNPSILNPDFLKANNIVSKDWKVSSPIFTTEQVSQVVYENGATIIVDANKINFTQPLQDGYSSEQVYVVDLAEKYLETLPHVNYYAIGINPLGHAIADSPETVQEYMTSYLMRPGDWKKFSGHQPILSASLTYSIHEDCRLTVSVESVEVADKSDSSQSQPAILFTGNIHKDFPTDGISPEKLETIKNTLHSWEENVSNYITLIKDSFLQSK